MPRKPVGIACNESVAVACEESVHSVVEQNQRLPKAKPFCRGYLPDACAFAIRPKLGICSTQGGSSKWCKKKPFCWWTDGVQLSICLYRAVGKGSIANAIHTPTDLFHVVKYKEEYLGVLGKEYTAKEQENRLKIDLTRLKDDAKSCRLYHSQKL